MFELSVVPIPVQFNQFPHIPHHLEYSYNGYEPSYPNYISYIYEDSFLPYIHPQQPFDGEGSTSASDEQPPSPVEHVQHPPPSHIDYFMNLDHYDITLPDVSTEPSWEPIDDFFLSILDRYTRFWRRYRNGTEYEDRTEEEEEEEEEDKEVEKSDNILKNVDEKFKTIDRLFEENKSINLSSQLTRLENVIYEPVQSV